MKTKHLKIEFEQEEDGRWIAEVLNLGVNGLLAYGETKDVAWRRAEALAFKVIAERLERGEMEPLVHGQALAFV